MRSDNAEVAGSIPASPTNFSHVRGTFEGLATAGDWTCIARSSRVNVRDGVRDGGLKKPIGTIVLTGRGLPVTAEAGCLRPAC
jgi:hypothetical protein